MLLAREEEQDGVAAPLHEPGAVVVGDREKLREAGVEGVAHLLGADLALAGETLGHRREAGDVDERERALDLLMAVVRITEKPVDQEPWDVWL